MKRWIVHAALTVGLLTNGCGPEQSLSQRHESGETEETEGSVEIPGDRDLQRAEVALTHPEWVAHGGPLPIRVIVRLSGFPLADAPVRVLVDGQVV